MIKDKKIDSIIKKNKILQESFVKRKKMKELVSEKAIQMHLKNKQFDEKLKESLGQLIIEKNSKKAIRLPYFFLKYFKNNRQLEKLNITTSFKAIEDKNDNILNLRS